MVVWAKERVGQEKEAGRERERRKRAQRKDVQRKDRRREQKKSSARADVRMHRTQGLQRHFSGSADSPGSRQSAQQLARRRDSPGAETECAAQREEQQRAQWKQIGEGRPKEGRTQERKRPIDKGRERRGREEERGEREEEERGDGRERRWERRRGEEETQGAQAANAVPSASSRAAPRSAPRRQASVLEAAAAHAFRQAEVEYG